MIQITNGQTPQASVYKQFRQSIPAASSITLHFDDMADYVHIINLSAVLLRVHSTPYITANSYISLEQYGAAKLPFLSGYLVIENTSSVTAAVVEGAVYTKDLEYYRASRIRSVNMSAPVWLYETWQLSGVSAANTTLTLTKGVGGTNHLLVTGYLVIVSGASPANDITISLKTGATVVWRDIITAAAAIGTRVAMNFLNPIPGGYGIDITLEILAGGVGVVTTANLCGYTAA